MACSCRWKMPLVPASVRCFLEGVSCTGGTARGGICHQWAQAARTRGRRRSGEGRLARVGCAGRRGKQPWLQGWVAAGLQPGACCQALHFMLTTVRDNAQPSTPQALPTMESKRWQRWWRRQTRWRPAAMCMQRGALLSASAPPPSSLGINRARLRHGCPFVCRALPAAVAALMPGAAEPMMRPHTDAGTN